MALRLIQGAPIPETDKEALRSLWERFEALNFNFNIIYSQLTNIQHAEPAKPRPGDFAVADGTSWNPGSGAGLYRRTATGAWEKL